MHTQDLLKVARELPVAERMLAYARHGDFEKVSKLLHEHKHSLNFNLRDFWAYSMIADEFIKHGQPPLALKKYLDVVSQFPVISPYFLRIPAPGFSQAAISG